MDQSNNSNQMLQMQIDILQISLDLEKQNSLLQSISIMLHIRTTEFNQFYSTTTC